MTRTRALSLTIKTAAVPLGERVRGVTGRDLRDLCKLILTLFIAASMANAQVPGATQNVVASIEAETDTPAPGDTVTVAIVMDPKSGWRDTDVQVDGPVVAEFQKLFLRTWEKQRGSPLAQKEFFPAVASPGKEIVRAIGSTPDDPYSLIYVTLISAINAALKVISVTRSMISLGLFGSLSVGWIGGSGSGPE